MADVGLVLSGGGARGFAHLGILQGLEEMGIKPKVISGVSAGAVIGAFLRSRLYPQTNIEYGQRAFADEYRSCRNHFGRPLFTGSFKRSIGGGITPKRVKFLKISLFVTTD